MNDQDAAITQSMETRPVLANSVRKQESVGDIIKNITQSLNILSLSECDRWSRTILCASVDREYKNCLR